MSDQEFVTKVYDVLIETLWNVKSEPTTEAPAGFSVLIETLWNVKKEISMFQNCRISF